MGRNEDRFLYYPSIGVRDYPYSLEEYRDKNKVWDMLEDLAEEYYQVSRGFIKKYKWSIPDIDGIEISRFYRLAKDMIIDIEEESDQWNEVKP